MTRPWADNDLRKGRGASPGRRWQRAAVAVAVVALPVIVSGVSAGPGLASAGNYAVTATIFVGDTPPGVGVDPSTHTAYVANSTDNTVSVIDGPPAP